VHHHPQPLERDGAVLTVNAKEGVKQASTQCSLLLAREAKHSRSVGPRSRLAVLFERGTRSEIIKRGRVLPPSQAGRLAGTVMMLRLGMVVLMRQVWSCLSLATIME
jgi:hypothetical protein